MTEADFVGLSLAHQMGNLGDKMLLIFSGIQSHCLESEVLGVLTWFDEIRFNHKRSWNQAKYTLLVTMTFPLVSFNSGLPPRPPPPCLVFGQAFVPPQVGTRVGYSLLISVTGIPTPMYYFFFLLI